MGAIFTSPILPPCTVVNVLLKLICCNEGARKPVLYDARTSVSFVGVQRNTDVFFKLAQAAVKGVVAPADTSGSAKPPKPKR